jgi:hypothetical protein
MHSYQIVCFISYYSTVRRPLDGWLCPRIFLRGAVEHSQTSGGPENLTTRVRVKTGTGIPANKKHFICANNDVRRVQMPTERAQIRCIPPVRPIGRRAFRAARKF